MTNKKLFLVLGVAAAAALSGCGNGKDATPSTTVTAQAQEPASEDAAPAQTQEPVSEESAQTQTQEPASEDDAQTQTQEPASEDAASDMPSESELTAAEGIAPVNPSDYLVKDPSEYITLGSLDQLTAEQTLYEISDDMVQNQIEDELYAYGEEVEAEKASEGNIVYADVVSTIHGDESSRSEESTYFTIGDADYGEEFDNQLIGASVNDVLNFSVTYDEDTWFDEWVGQTVDFEVSVTGVYEMSVPDYDDDFIATYTDYSSKAEYEDAIRESLASDYEQMSYTDTVSSLFQSAMDLSTYNGYPEELYTSCEDEIISYYGQFVGESDTDAILDTLGITREDLEEDILYTVNYRLLISAIAQEQGIEVTADEYTEEITNGASDYGYSDPAAYEADMGRESIVWSLYEDKVAEYLYDTASISTVTADADDTVEEEVIDLDDAALEEEEDSSGIDEDDAVLEEEGDGSIMVLGEEESEETDGSETAG